MRLLISLALVFCASHARAAVLFEPYGGYSLGTISGTSTSGTSTSGSANGFDYGGRLGFMIQHFLILAYEYQGVSATYAQSGQANESFTQGTSYATVGFQAFNGFRLMGSYGFSTSGTLATTPQTTFTGSAYKILAGYKFRREVALNVEYTIFNYNKYQTNGVTSPVSSAYSKLDTSAVMFTLSVPITLFNQGR